MKEKFVKITFNKKYLISNCGNVYSEISNKTLKPRLHNQGYLRVSISKKDYYIHRLVAYHFIGISNKEVNHIDGNKANNKLNNLEYVTSFENKKHAWKNKLYKHNGESCHLSKLNENLVREIKFHNIKSATELSKLYNIPRKTINNIQLGNSWKHIHKRVVE